jgi:peptidyl-prolyl cis-trans isomerase SurA
MRGDPLLGPNPDLMPPMDTPVRAAAKRGTAPARAAGPAPKAANPPGDLPLEAAPPPPLDPQTAPGDLTPRKPADPANPTGTGQNQPPQADSPPSSDPHSPATAALKPAPRSDPAVRQASFNAGPTELAIDRNWKEAGRAAARVGDEVITLHDLVLSVKEQLRKNPPGRGLTRPETNMVAKSVLAGLIERSLIVQEAKRELKNPKQLDRLNEAADKFWREEELPSMMRRYMADTELQLRQKFAESGRSLEALHQSYRQEFLAQVFLQNKLADKQKVELPEMLKYYNEHLHDKEFDRPAVITWRELVVEKGRHPDPADARRKAESLLARLNRGADFAALARTESEGPTRVRAEGGLMQTSPGSYAVEAVNAALGSLPLNQISPILEGPTSLHIVRVENRRAAGPATWEEVQDQIRLKLRSEKIMKARANFVAKLRRQALVSTIFDGTESDPDSPEER